MKNINKTILTVTMLLAMAAWLYSCKKDNSGVPVINYVRVTDPNASDSLLASAFQGQLLAIMGENLEGAKELWFNDKKSVLTPAYVTGKSILASVPNEVPLDITNKLRLVFNDGFELLYDFKVDISAPSVLSMPLEYVKDGEVAYIRGGFFYAPVKVTFPGGVDGEIVELEDELIAVRVPVGAQPGRITVTTNFGSTQSDFMFRDNRPMLIHNETCGGWWNGCGTIVSGADPLAINGAFNRIKQSIGSWGWVDWLGGPRPGLDTRFNLANDAVLNPAKYVMKFEINTLKPYNNNMIKIVIGQVASPDPDWNTEPYFFRPPFDTKGAWQTVSIPFSEVVAGFKTNWGVNAEGYGVRILFSGSGALDADIAFDNLRVVPIELD